MKKNKAQFILRGLRSTIDFEYEKAIGQINHEMKPAIETVILLSQQKYTSVSSIIIRDIIMNGGDASSFLPEVIAKDISGHP